MHFHVIYEVLHSELMEKGKLCLMQMMHSSRSEDEWRSIRLFKFKSTLMKEKNVFSADAPKRSGGLDAGTRYFEEIVAMNVTQPMKIRFYENIDGACISIKLQERQS
jgi:hypothetical protein